MAKFPTYEEMAEEVAERALDEFLYMDKSLREWIKLIASEDVISRQAVLDLVNADWKYEGLESDIANLPPITSPLKTGHWVKHETGHSVYYDCSLCGCAAPCTETADTILWKMANYCPDCGARMKEVEEE